MTFANSKKKTILIDHIALTLNMLRSEHPHAGVILAGDRNDLKLENLCGVDTSLKQIVRKATRGPIILDIVLTDLYQYYEEPQMFDL